MLEYFVDLLEVRDKGDDPNLLAAVFTAEGVDLKIRRMSLAQVEVTLPRTVPVFPLLWTTCVS